MAKGDPYGASELEREFELEMGGNEDAFSQSVDDTEFDFEEANGPDRELGINETLAERLAALASREFESESEMDDHLNEAFDDAADQFLGKAFKKLGSRVLKSAPGLLKKVGGLSGLKGLLPMDLLKKSLMTAAKSVMATNPALAALAPAIGPALKSLGLGETEYGEPNEEVWRNFETMTDSAYEYLVGNLTDQATQPLSAIQLAGKSLQHGINAARAASGARPHGGARRRRVVTVRGGRPGDELIIRFV
jgi:hypothetical protein